MASYDYDKNKPAADAKKAKDATMVTEVIVAVDKEKIARHDMAHHKDMELAAMLQASWGKLVDAEHNYKH